MGVLWSSLDWPIPTPSSLEKQQVLYSHRYLLAYKSPGICPRNWFSCILTYTVAQPGLVDPHWAMGNTT